MLRSDVGGDVTYPMMHMMYLSPHRQTDACENITFLQLRLWRGGNNDVKSQLVTLCHDIIFILRLFEASFYFKTQLVTTRDTAAALSSAQQKFISLYVRAK